MDEKESLKTPRTTVKRLAERGHYERAEVCALLDSGFICHIGFCVDNQPFVIPTAYWRQEDYIYFHGSAASRTLKALSGAIPVCLTATHVDGLVLARSGFNHSINYRSVVVLGVATVVRDPREKAAAMRAFVDYVLPGRWSEIRAPNDQELRATLVLKIPIQEASVKVRSGGPEDEPADLSRRHSLLHTGGKTHSRSGSSGGNKPTELCRELPHTRVNPVDCRTIRHALARAGTRPYRQTESVISG